MVEFIKAYSGDIRIATVHIREPRIKKASEHSTQAEVWSIPLLNVGEIVTCLREFSFNGRRFYAGNSYRIIRRKNVDLSSPLHIKSDDFNFFYSLENMTASTLPYELVTTDTPYMDLFFNTGYGSQTLGIFRARNPIYRGGNRGMFDN